MEIGERIDTFLSELEEKEVLEITKITKKVVKKQHRAKDCFVCGIDNPLGLKCNFYEMEDETLVGLVKAQSVHQSYPGRVHGGVSAALLDECIGRALSIFEDDKWGVTVELNTRYLMPVPYDTDLIVSGKITRNTKRIFEGEGEIILPNGQIAVKATAKYMKLKIRDIAGTDDLGEHWDLYSEGDEPKEIEIPFS